MTTTLPRETIEPKSSPRNCIIWLHGLGADGNDFVPIVPELGLPDALAIRYVFPHAPVRPVTINGGMEMRAWYDILRIAEDGMNVDHIHESSAQIEALIEEQIATGIPAERILLAGFSQGGTIALHTSLRLHHALAGTIALSTWLPPDTGMMSQYEGPNRNAPLFQAHGLSDMVVPHGLGQMTRHALQGLGCEIDWFEYEMGHQVCGQQIADLGSWINRVLS